jgi:hypothetical protein
VIYGCLILGMDSNQVPYFTNLLVLKDWLRGGKNGSMLRLVAGKSMRDCREDLTGEKIRCITKMPLNCLVEDEVMDKSGSIPPWIIGM